MNYLIAVLSNRVQAEAAYSALTEANLPMAQVTILGRGYKSADEFGLIDPNVQAQKQARGLFYWLVPFGFVAGYAFNYLTGIEIAAALGPIGNHLVGGLLGAIAGALGSFLVGGGVGLTVGSGDALSYRNRLNAGKYLIAVQGSEALIRSATAILRQFEPENLQGYNTPEPEKV